jgi:hypothetical protein
MRREIASGSLSRTGGAPRLTPRFSFPSSFWPHRRRGRRPGSHKPRQSHPDLACACVTLGVANDRADRVISHESQTGALPVSCRTRPSHVADWDIASRRSGLRDRAGRRAAQSPDDTSGKCENDVLLLMVGPWAPNGCRSPQIAGYSVWMSPPMRDDFGAVPGCHPDHTRGGGSMHDGALERGEGSLAAAPRSVSADHRPRLQSLPADDAAAASL